MFSKSKVVMQSDENFNSISIRRMQFNFFSHCCVAHIHISFWQSRSGAAEPKTNMKQLNMARNFRKVSYFLCCGQAFVGQCSRRRQQQAFNCSCNRTACWAAQNESFFMRCACLGPRIRQILHHTSWIEIKMTRNRRNGTKWNGCVRCYLKCVVCIL